MHTIRLISSWKAECIDSASQEPSPQSFKFDLPFSFDSLLESYSPIVLKRSFGSPTGLAEDQDVSLVIDLSLAEIDLQVQVELNGSKLDVLEKSNLGLQRSIRPLLQARNYLRLLIARIDEVSAFSTPNLIKKACLEILGS